MKDYVAKRPPLVPCQLFELSIFALEAFRGDIYIFCELFKLNDIQLVNVRVKISVGSKTQNATGRRSRVQPNRSRLFTSEPFIAEHE